MSDEVKVGTCGFDHVGLSVRDLATSRKFFCDCLGWHVVGERPDYPAVFLSDGHCVLTLWEVAPPDMAIAFDRCANVGLHHLALAVARSQGAKLMELRASICLARLWRRQDKRDDARDLLAPLHSWFTEGLDTPVLGEAEALLEELAP